jgi:predicted nucleic acid-binding protein
MRARLLDTSVLLRAIQRQNPQLRALARDAIRRLYRAGDTLCVCPQNLIELWGVCTRPTGVNGLALSAGDAEKYIARGEAFFRLLPDTAEIYPEWERLVSVHQVAGLKVHDARLVAAMNVNEITSIVTFDIDDFKRYPEIEVSHPERIVNG